MKTVVTQFIEQAKKDPARIAVLDKQGAITYGRMNNLSETIRNMTPPARPACFQGSLETGGLFTLIIQQGSQPALCQHSQASGGAGHRRIETVSGKRGIRIGIRVGIRQDHAVKFQAFCVGQCNEEDSFFRQAVTGTNDGDPAVLRKHCSGLFQASGAGAEDGGEPLFFFRLLYCPKEITRVLFLSLPDAENRLGAGGLHRGDEDLFFFWKKACEKGCDLGGRAVTGGQLKLRHTAGFSRAPCGAGAWNRRVLKEVVDLCKGRGSLPDRLEFVSEEHKSCPGEIRCSPALRPP